MSKKINFIAIFCIGGFLCAFFCSLAHGEPELNPAEALKKEKEALVERLLRAQMESEMISYQRKQLDIEQRDIAKQQKIVADKERKLQSSKPRETLQQRLEAQSGLLARSRRQLDEARRNVDLQIETLRSEIIRQELERKSFLSKSNLNELKRRQQGQEEAARAKEELKKRAENERQEQQRRAIAAGLEKKKRDTEELAKKERYLNCKQEARRSEREQQAIEKEAARQEQERVEIEKRDSAHRVKEAALRVELDTCKQALSAIEQEKNSADRQSMQDRLDKLLEKQRALLDASRLAERDLLKQKQNVQELLEKAQATTFNKEMK